MHRRNLLTLALIAFSAPAFAQEEGGVLIPSELELKEEQKGALQESVEDEVAAALKQCVSAYPRPEFFTSLVLDYTVKKSGKLTGGYVGGAAPEPGIYVKDDAERAKLETAGSFARLVVRNDRDLERCMKKKTGVSNSGLERYSLTIAASFDVAWSGKTPKLTATKFEVTRNK